MRFTLTLLLMLLPAAPALGLTENDFDHPPIERGQEYINHYLAFCIQRDTALELVSHTERHPVGGCASGIGRYFGKEYGCYVGSAAWIPSNVLYMTKFREERSVKDRSGRHRIVWNGYSLVEGNIVRGPRKGDAIYVITISRIPKYFSDGKDYYREFKDYSDEGKAAFQNCKHK